MENKKIPYLFEAFVSPESSQVQPISNEYPNIGRLKLGAFSKYKNRNGSYITDEVAEYLIDSIKNGDVPVVGFFNKETTDWEGHTGPNIASGYGYAEKFLGWEKLMDTDGIEREYAMFSIVIFSNYFNEARTIPGKGQSMELDPEKIEGDWGMIGDEECFIFTKAAIRAFCVLGDNHEPCFSASAFFEKSRDDIIKQFTRLHGELKKLVEKADKEVENEMFYSIDFENKDLYEKIFSNLNPNFSNENPVVDEIILDIDNTHVQSFSINSKKYKSYTYAIEEDALVINFESEKDCSIQAIENYEGVESDLRGQIEAKDNELDTLKQNFETEKNGLNEKINEFETKITNLNEEIENYKNEISTYELEKKNNLIEDYRKVLGDDISEIENEVANYSFEDLKVKLALAFSEKNLENKDFRVPSGSFGEPKQKTRFELLMENHKRK